MKIRPHKIKLFVLLGITMISLFFSTASANGCWLWSMHQRKCPESLIK
ncbi:AgrD family cyclic lactone autoinducer peptide [Ruminiclostridium josui]|nr:cyclic lactone autoinducer peptide [Ruminiclostridium josui]